MKDDNYFNLLPNSSINALTIKTAENKITIIAPTTIKTVAKVAGMIEVDTNVGRIIKANPDRIA